MSDRYASFANSGPGRAVVRRLGLPDPPRLRRYAPGDPLVAGPVRLGGSGRLSPELAKLLSSFGAALDFDGAAFALVFDATGLASPDSLAELYDFFHAHARPMYPCGRVVVFGTPPLSAGSPAEAIAQRALEGFVRSVGKEFGQGRTAQLVYVAPGAEDGLESTLRFLLSARSAYVSGQVIHVSGASPAPGDWTKPLAGKTALVTGAARGIGAAIARVLARDGAHVACLDVPAAGDALSTVANDIGGTAVQLDLTSTDAPARVVDFVSTRFGAVDILVHNAGITRDRTIAKMSPEGWSSVLDVNLLSQSRVNSSLLDGDLVPSGGRIVCVSSVSGIAGNRGQTNYATSKAGVIGLVEAYAPILRERGITINAVAPGFIETKMTAAMPMTVREAGRRLNSMAQGGLPMDVAETIAWFASPGSSGVTGNVVRVCGQSLLGA